MEVGAPAFSRWCHAGVWERIFDALTADLYNQYLLIDSTIVRAQQQAVSGKGAGSEPPGLTSDLARRSLRTDPNHAPAGHDPEILEVYR